MLPIQMFVFVSETVKLAESKILLFPRLGNHNNPHHPTDEADWLCDKTLRVISLPVDVRRGFRLPYAPM
jgi:hypothetical protein